MFLPDDTLSVSGKKFRGLLAETHLALVDRFETEEISVAISTRKIKEPEGLAISKSAYSCPVSYGLPLSMVNLPDGSIAWGDGVNELKVLNENGCFNLGIKAPRDAPEAEDAASLSVITRMYPIEAGTVGSNDFCLSGGAARYRDFDEYFDGSSSHIDNGDGTVVRDLWQFVDDLSTTDYITCKQGAPGVTAANGTCAAVAVGTRTRYAIMKLNAPAYTPDVDTGHTLTIVARYREVGNPHDLGYVLNFRLALSNSHSFSIFTEFAGTNFDETDIQAVTPGGSFTSNWVALTLSLSASEAAAITDYTSLYAKIDVTARTGAGDSGKYFKLDVAEIYWDLPAPTDPTILSSGEYAYAFSYYSQYTNAESGLSPELNHTHANNNSVCVSNLLLSLDPQVTHLKLYRTSLSGGPFYLHTTIENSNPDGELQGCGGTDITGDGTFYADNILDAKQDPVLINDGLTDVIDDETKRSFGEGLPPKALFLALHQNRLFGIGRLPDNDYVGGTATFTNQSYTVTGTGTQWTQRMENRFIKVNGRPDDESYLIARVVSTTEMELTTVFEQSTAEGASYTVKDINFKKNTLWWSEPGIYTDIPSANAIDIDWDGSPEGGTGIRAHEGRLYITFRNSLKECVGQDGTYSIYPIYEGVGSVSQRGLVASGDTLHFPGEDDLYSFNGGTPVSISSPPAQNGEILGIGSFIDGINKSCLQDIVAIWDENEKVVKTWIALDEIHNDHALVFDLNTKSWSLDETPSIISAALIYDGNNSQAYICGGLWGELWQTGIGDSDGAYKGTLVARVTSATSTRIECAGASFDITGNKLYGLPAYLVNKRGEPHKLTIINNDEDTLILAYPLPIVPDDSYWVFIGGIEERIETGDSNFGEVHQPTNLKFIEAVFEPKSDGKLYVKTSVDFGNMVLMPDTLDFTKKTGACKVYVRTKGKHTRLRLVGWAAGHPLQIQQIDFTVANNVPPAAEED